MAVRQMDVAVIGSGFGGSLLALLLARQGRRVVLVDRAAHPRFAIGESSTPIADRILDELARAYDLPELAPLAQYGTWCRVHPEVMRGRKRGFSYYRHERQSAFRPQPTHANALLVAASSDDDRCDTHWLRADVDQFLARAAVHAGVELLENTRLEECRRVSSWHLRVRGAASETAIEAEFLVDATGSGGLARQWLGVADDTARMQTYSRAVYSHFEGVERWTELVTRCGEATEEYPFDCDAAALHHVCDDAWMWLLRFDDERVSAGWVLGPSHAAVSLDDPGAVWRRWLADYPSIHEQFRSARLAAQPGQLMATARLQRRAARAAGERWAALPHAYGFVDPLHSTGIAFTLSGVERLAALLDQHWGRPTLAVRLREYEQQLDQELTLIDQLVHIAYATSPVFPLFILAAMLYFTATVTYENRRQPGGQDSFLCASNAALREIIDRLCARLLDARRQGPAGPHIAAIWQEVRAAIAPFNTAGLCDEQAANLYRHTAAR